MKAVIQRVLHATVVGAPLTFAPAWRFAFDRGRFSQSTVKRSLRSNAGYAYSSGLVKAVVAFYCLRYRLAHDGW